MKLEITVTKGKHAGQQLIINRPGVYRIGHKAGSDLTLTEDRHVSRHHCQIDLTPEGVCHIIDTRSRGGTYVNGEQVQKAQLIGGDKIRVGQMSDGSRFVRKRQVLIPYSSHLAGAPQSRRLRASG